VTYNKERMAVVQNKGGVTYSLQYTTKANPSDSDWHTYSQIKNHTLDYPQILPVSDSAYGTANTSGLTVVNSDLYADYIMKIDPRTDRFSVSETRAKYYSFNANGVIITPTSDPVDLTPASPPPLPSNYTESYNPTSGAGTPTTTPVGPPQWTSTEALPYTFNASGRTTTWFGTTVPTGANAPTSSYLFPNYNGSSGSANAIDAFFLGGIVQNTSTSTIYYTDPDNILRRGDAAYATTSPLDGLPGVWNTSSPNGINLARPVILNRPFRSVGELGYAFRDLPFKTLDFFTKDSGDAALLDLFSVSDGDVVAGRIDVNTRNVAALAEVLSGVAINPLHVSDSSSSSLSPSQATGLAGALAAFTTVTPMRSLAELVTTATALNGSSHTQETILSDSSAAYSSQNSKIQRESAIRTLGEAGNARTWNLLIDIIAQSGRYPPNLGPGASLDSFIPNGEKRFWLHVAIDRYTGQVVDRFLEPVQE
jgi:hypothetical protein